MKSVLAPHDCRALNAITKKMWFKTLIWASGVLSFFGISGGPIILACKLFLPGHIAAAITAVALHIFVFALVVRLITRPGELPQRVRYDHEAAIVLGVWAIATWVAACAL